MTRSDAEILTVEDLAALFACDKETAAARLTSGDLPGVKLGRGWVIPRLALFERLNEKAREEAAARRAQHAIAFADAQRGSAAPAETTSTVANTRVSVLTNSASKQTGRKRRTPPPLPPLSNVAARPDPTIR